MKIQQSRNHETETLRSVDTAKNRVDVISCMIRMHHTRHDASSSDHLGGQKQTPHLIHLVLPTKRVYSNSYSISKTASLSFTAFSCESKSSFQAAQRRSAGRGQGMRGRGGRTGQPVQRAGGGPSPAGSCAMIPLLWNLSEAGYRLYQHRSLQVESSGSDSGCDVGDTNIILYEFCKVSRNFAALQGRKQRFCRQSSTIHGFCLILAELQGSG